MVWAWIMAGTPSTPVLETTLLVAAVIVGVGAVAFIEIPRSRSP